MSGRQENPEVFLSMPHPCSYLPGKTATTLFIDPRVPLTSEKYGRLTHLGFRRSGDLVYRPRCPDCTACIPVRVPVARFSPSRGQKRTWRKNADVETIPRPARFVQEHFDLYLRYQASRHPGGGMDVPDAHKYSGFLIGRQVETVFYELRVAQRLVAVMVVDQLNDGLSAVYTFFDPADSERGLGTYAILWQIEHARQRRLPWVYLGYWIAASPKMAYKTNFRPLEVYRQDRWVDLE